MHYSDSPPLTPEGGQGSNAPSAESSPGAASPWTYEYVTAEKEDEVATVPEPSLRRLMVSPAEDEILPAPEESEEAAEEDDEEIVDGPIDSESYVPDHWA